MEKKPKSEKPVDSQEKKDELDNQNSQDQQIREMGQVLLSENQEDIRVELLTIIGEVEGHESAPSHSKTTKYEHVLPKLAMIEDDQSIEGLLILLNTVGGDVEAGLAIAEMIASLSKPTVSLVLGGGHSIGVPMAVSADYSFVVPSATMVIHPVRSSGMFIGVAQTYRNMEKIQDRITGFISRHSKGKAGGTDAGYYTAGKGCGNHAGRGGSSKGRADRRSGRHKQCITKIVQYDTHKKEKKKRKFVIFCEFLLY